MQKMCSFLELVFDLIILTFSYTQQIKKDHSCIRIYLGCTYINTCGAKPNEAGFCNKQKEQSICLFSVVKETPNIPNNPKTAQEKNNLRRLQ